jgi:hypothetical protein
VQKAAGEQFYNTSRFDFATLIDAPDDLADNLKHYVASFSASARDVLDKFDFTTQIDRLDRSKLLYLVMSKFADVDLHPDAVSNLEMGYLYEELIRKFSELSNETAGEHFTPREVIADGEPVVHRGRPQLTKPGIVKTIYDGACGTGGMLSVAEDRLRELNPEARLQVYGQELNAETYAICRSDMMLKGQDATNIAYGNSFSEDGHPGLQVDYSIQNPPFGVEWKKVADAVKDEHNKLGSRRTLRGRAAPHQRRQLPVPPERHLQDEAGGSGRLTGGHRVQRLAVVHRCGRIGRVRDPPVDHRERLAGGRGRPARPVVLQHRHLHLLLDRHQPEVPRTPGHGATGGCPQLLREDAQEPGREAQAGQRRPDRRHRPLPTAS